MTNSIEGILSTRKDINDLIIDIENNINKKNRLESVVNKYILLLKDSEISLKSSQDVRKLYDEFLLHEVVSEKPENKPDGFIFRKNNVNVSKLDGSTIHRGVNPENAIIQYMDTSLNILNNDELDPILRGAIFHYLFAYIHPFYDGNGRMARFITSNLYSRVLTPIVGYRISMSIKDNLSDYYDGFKLTNDVRNRGDIGTFVDLFLSIIIKGLDKTITYANAKKKEFDEKWSAIKKEITSDLSAKETKLINYLLQAKLFSEFGITVNDITNIGNVAKDRTVRNLLNGLVNKGIATRAKIGLTYYYSLSDTVIFDTQMNNVNI